jgi:hypothetical protein
MKEKDKSKVSFVRERLTVEVTEAEVIEIVQREIQKQYPNFCIDEVEIVCGMAQGSGYFENLRAQLTWERNEHA